MGQIERPCAVAAYIGPDGETVPSTEALLAAALCNDARLIGRRIAGDPVDAALLRWVQTHGAAVAALRSPHPRLQIDRAGGVMSVTCRFDGILHEYAKGAPDALAPRLRGAGFPLPIIEEIERAPDATWLALAGGPLGAPLASLGLIRLGDVAVSPAADLEALAGLRFGETRH